MILLFLKYSANDHKTQQRRWYHGWPVAVKLFLKKSSGSASYDNFFFMFLLETIYLTTELFWNFVLEFIICHQIIPIDIEIHIRSGEGVSVPNILLNRKISDTYHHKVFKYWNNRLHFNFCILISSRNYKILFIDF